MTEFSCQSPIKRPSVPVGRRVEAIREHLLIHARSYFPALSGSISIRIEEVKRPSTNALARFVLSDGCTTARVIAKWTPIYTGNNEGLTEFEHYRLFNSRCGGDSGFGCPTALCFVEGENILLTEEQEGLPLRDACRSLFHRTPSRRVLQASILSGRWLNAFHYLASPTKLPIRSAWRLLEKLSPCIFDAYLAKRELSAVITNQMRLQIGHSRQALARCSCVCKVGAIHKDFGPGNILVSDKTITVLDAASNEVGPQLIDVADFLGYMHLLSTVSLRTTRSCEKFTNEFLRAYLGSARIQSAEEALLNLLKIGATARTYERHLGTITLMPAPLRRSMASYCAHRYRRVLQVLIARASDCVREMEAPVRMRSSISRSPFPPAATASARANPQPEDSVYSLAGRALL